jgi:hypothetical protein
LTMRSHCLTVKTIRQTVGSVRKPGYTNR